METIRTRTVQRAAVVRPAVPAPAPAARRVQASSLRVSSPSDPAEKEAEATAKKVVGMQVPESSVALVKGPGGGGVFRRVKGKEEEEKDRLPGGKKRLKMESPYVARFAGALRGKDEIQRKGEGAPNVAANVAAEIQASAGSGAPLPLSVRRFMEPRFRADFSAVRVHTGDKAAGLSRQLNARAFAVGNQIFFGRGQFKPETAEGKELIAHELTHTVQQGAAPPQARRSEDVAVTQKSAEQVQRLGLSDALDHFAGAANAIPGFRMFTIVLGVNPINMSRVERSAANILRALVEFIPGGALIVAALDNYGVFDRAGAWVEQQIRALGMTGSLIRDAINRFLNSLSWSDIFDLGGVWERAKSIFTEPIGRIIATAKSIGAGIIEFVKDAVVRPLAGLAEGTRGYDLLKAVMGRDPITGDPFPRNADTLIGGFMKLIGQEEVWGNLKRANAVARAWAWFQGALASLMSFVEAIPATFMAAVRSLEIADLVLLPRAFAKVATVFGNFIGSFISWAGNAVWNLLEIVFDVVSPGAFGYIKKTGGALRSILRNPLPFVGNLVKAAKLGFSNFAGNFGTHLKAGLIEWLTGSMPGIYIPKAFSLAEIVKFVFSVLGISWANIRAKLVKVVGEPAVKAMETGFDIVVTLVTQGPAAAWDKIKDMLGNLKDMVIGGITDFVVDAVAKKAVPKLLALFVPGAGFISAILTIYDTVMVFVNKISKIAQVVSGFINSIVSIASGAIGAAASRVESTLAGLLSLAISFLAGFAGLGNVSAKLMGIINSKVRTPIDKALDGIIAWIVAQARRLGKFIAQAGVPQDPGERLRLAARDAVIAARALGGRATGSLLERALGFLKTRYGLTSIDVYERGGKWRARIRINPEVEQELVESAAGGAGVPEVRVPVTMGGAQHTLSIGGAGGATIIMASAAGPLVRKVDAAIASYRAAAGAKPDRERLAAMQGIREAAVRVEREAEVTSHGFVELTNRLRVLGNLIGSYALRYDVKDLDALNPANDVMLIVQNAEAAADQIRLAPVSLGTILLQIERHMGPAWGRFVQELPSRVHALTRESLVHFYGLKHATWLIEEKELLEHNGAYDRRRDLMFVRVDRNINEVSASVVHEATHNLQKRFNLKLSGYHREFQAHTVQRQFLLRLPEHLVPEGYKNLYGAKSEAALRYYIAQKKYGFPPELELTQAADFEFIKSLVRTKFAQI